MKDNSFAAGCGVAFLLMVALCAFSVLMGPAWAAQDAKANMAAFTPVPATSTQPAGSVPAQGYVSEDALSQMLSDLEQHDERMTDKVVTVAKSGDAAQTITAVSGDAAGAVIPCMAGLVMVAAIAFLAMRGGGSSGS